jgi:hypothetical protein
MIKQIAIIWSIQDVQEQRPDLTDEQASDVLQAMKTRHDANFGINWNVIDTVSEMLYPI